MMSNEKGMALVPLLLTIFIALALVGAAIFMIGDGILYNRDIRRSSQEQNNTLKEDNTIEDSNVTNYTNSISSDNA